MTRKCPKTEPHLWHTWGIEYADMGIAWEECPGVEYPRFEWPSPAPMLQLTDTNGEELIERALRQRRGESA